MENKAFDEFCNTVELPTMSQFATRLACTCERERAFFMGGFAAGQAAEREETCKWISVADRLPLKQGDVVNYATVDVIAADRTGEVKVREFALGNTDKANPWHSFDECVDGYVTHWMPLPDPPKP